MEKYDYIVELSYPEGDGIWRLARLRRTLGYVLCNENGYNPLVKLHDHEGCLIVTLGDTVTSDLINLYTAAWAAQGESADRVEFETAEKLA